MSPVQVLCVVALTAVGLALTAPQTVLLLRGRAAAGVSVPGLLCSVLSYAAWARYAAEVHDRVFLLSLLLPVALEGVTLALSIRYRGEWHGWALPILWAAGLTVAAALGQVVLGAVLAVSILWEYGPPAFESWRAPDVSGVSVGAWRVRVADGVLWTGYGVIALNVQLVVAGSIAAVLALFVLAGLRQPRAVAGVGVAAMSRFSA